MKLFVRALIFTCVVAVPGILLSDEGGLIEAIMSNQAKQVEEAIKSGANVNALNQNGETPIMIASEKGVSAIVKLLIDARADVNVKRKNGVTALMMASDRGHTEAARLLIEAKADLNAEASNGNTALFWASIRGHAETVKLLLASGASTAHKNKNGRTALDEARAWRRTEVIKAFADKEFKSISRSDPGTKAEVKEKAAEKAGEEEEE